MYVVCRISSACLLEYERMTQVVFSPKKTLKVNYICHIQLRVE